MIKNNFIKKIIALFYELHAPIDDLSIACPILNMFCLRNGLLGCSINSTTCQIENHYIFSL